jgi:3-keto-disaccharide hydrolase
MRCHYLYLAGLLAALLQPARAADDATTIELFNGKDLTGWKVFITPADKGKTKPEDVWSVKEGVLQCVGKPAGYVITEKEYGDYVLEVEWRWPGKPGNSGVLCHVSGPDKIWPNSFEAQLFATRAGDIWLVDGFKMDVDKSRLDPNQSRHYIRIGDRFVKKDGKDKKGRDQYVIEGKPVEKPTGEWNHYRITCKGDTVKLEVNGKFVNEGKNAERTKGKILLQSEGAPVHFRNVKLTPIK